MNEDADRFTELDEDVKNALRRMSPEEVETWLYISTIPKDEIKRIRKFVLDVQAVNRFLRWLIIGCISLFLGGVALGESVIKLLNWFRGPPQ